MDGDPEMNNWLTFTDVYKLGHMDQYPKGTTEVYSYLHTRTNKMYNKCTFFGLQYLLKNYLSQPITHEMIDELCWINYHLFDKLGKNLEGNDLSPLVNLKSLMALRYLPLKICAVPEGTQVHNPNALMTIENTHPDFYWLPGYLESFFLHLWAPCTVASMSRKYYETAKRFSDLTCDTDEHLPYAVHDFGYRGVSSNETAAICGASHLLHFFGSDTIPAIKLVKDYYSPCKNIAKSVPASEHSVMCAFGRDFELDAFENMLNQYPTGIVSIVADTYDIYNAVTVIAGKLKDKILARNGKVVFRPDSGNPNEIINGKWDSQNIAAQDGVLKCLAQVFGTTLNNKGYRVLNEKVGLIYGDGITLDRYEEILYHMKEKSFASSNLVVGVGGLLLQRHTRDDMGFSVKATNVKVNEEIKMIQKDPITDSGKKSHTGRMILIKENGIYSTKDKIQGMLDDTKNEMRPVYLNGDLLTNVSFDEIRKNCFR